MGEDDRNKGYVVPPDRASVLEDIGYDPTLYTENAEGIVRVRTPEYKAIQQEYSTEKLEPRQLTLEDTKSTWETNCQHFFGISLSDFASQVDNWYNVFTGPKDETSSTLIWTLRLKQIQLVARAIQNNDELMALVQDKGKLAELAE